MDYYAGIGSRETPEHILNIMHHIGAYLATQGWVLRSGAANGADASFNIRQTNSPMENAMMGTSILEFTHRAIEDVSAYNYVVNQAKH